MAVVRLRGSLKKLAGNAAEHDVDGSTVADLLASLEQAHPALAGWVVDERGRIRRHINVYVDTERVAEDDPVPDGATVDVLPAISGG